MVVTGSPGELASRAKLADRQIHPKLADGLNGSLSGGACGTLGGSLSGSLNGWGRQLRITRSAECEAQITIRALLQLTRKPDQGA